MKMKSKVYIVPMTGLVLLSSLFGLEVCNLQWHEIPH